MVAQILISMAGKRGRPRKIQTTEEEPVSPVIVTDEGWVSSTIVDDLVEVPVKIKPTSVSIDFLSEGLNNLARKINEIINYL